MIWPLLDFSRQRTPPLASSYCSNLSGRRVLLDPLDGACPVALVLVALAGGRDDLAVAGLQPPAILPLGIGVRFELDRPSRSLRLLAARA